MPVPSWTRSVASAAKASGGNGSVLISKLTTPSKPAPRPPAPPGRRPASRPWGSRVDAHEVLVESDGRPARPPRRTFQMPERRERGLRFFSRVRRPEPPERTVSRVLFRRAVARAPARIIHLGDALLRRSSAPPGHRAPPRGGAVGRAVLERCPYLSLLREGLAPPPVTRLSRVGPYPTFSPLPVPPPGATSRTPGLIGHRRCGFCCAFPRVTPGRR